MEVPIHFLRIILREMEYGVRRDMHQTISLFKGYPQRTGPSRLDTTVETLPL
jgi:hypothetical protein